MSGLIFFAILIWVVVLIVKWKLPYIIGKSGENFVSRKLGGLDPNQYKIVGDLMLPSSGNTNTTQIDHVVVSNYGIFCIETKNYSGWIFGGAHQQYWTQVIYKFKKRFFNPLRQNYAHIKALESLILPLYPSISIHGFVAFPSANKLKISGTDVVGSTKDVIEKIKTFTAKTLSDLERDKIYEILTSFNITDKEARSAHNKDVRDLNR